MKRKGICLALVMMLILGMVGSTALAGNRPSSVISGGLSMWYWPGEGSITYIDVGYEKALNSGLALHGKGSLGLVSGVTNLGGLVGVKKYLAPTAPEGLWIGAFGTFSYFSVFGISATTFGGGVEGGYRYLYATNRRIELFAQVGNYTAGVGFAVSFGVNVSYAL